MSKIKQVVLLLAVAIFAGVLFSQSAAALPVGRNYSEREAVQWRRNGECPTLCGALWIASFNANTHDEIYNTQNNINLNSGSNSIYTDSQGKLNLRLKLLGTILGGGGRSGTRYAKITYVAASYNDGVKNPALPIRADKTVLARDFRNDDFGDAHINNPSYYGILTVNIDDIIKNSNNDRPTLNIRVRRCLSDANGQIEGVCQEEVYPVSLNLPRYQTKARSYVKTGNNSDSNWGEASRTITVKYTGNAANDTVYFKHTLENIGNVPNTKLGNVLVRANDEYAKAHSTNTTLQQNGNVTRSGGIFAQASPTGSKQLNNSYMTYTIQKKDIGKTLCTSIEFVPSARYLQAIDDDYQNVNIHGIGYTEFACVYVAKDYSTSSSVSFSNAQTDCAVNNNVGGSCNIEVEAGTTNIPILAKILRGDSSKTNATDINWKLSYFVTRPNQTQTGNAASRDSYGNSRLGYFDEANVDSNPCLPETFYNRSAQIYQAGEANVARKIQGCTTISGGKIAELTGDQRLNAELYGRTNLFDVPEDAEIGTKYCFAVSVSPYLMDPTWSREQQASFKGWHHGQSGCIVVVKKPKTQVLGGGVSTAEGAYGLNSTRSVNGTNRMYGSWIEYELMALNGSNSRIATNGVFSTPNRGLIGGNTLNLDYQNRLTFANKDSSNYGNFGSGALAANMIQRMKGIYSAKTATSTANNIGMNQPSSEQIIKPTSKTVISNTVIGSKSIIVYAPDQEVEIRDNILQNAGIRSLEDVAQMIIIAKKIKIHDNVTRIDAWLMAEEVNTCANVAKINSNNCANPLEINGVVATSGEGESLKLHRTAGSTGVGDGIGSPAEVIRLTPDVYQWLLNQGSFENAKITTTYSKELPVRY